MSVEICADSGAWRIDNLGECTFTDVEVDNDYFLVFQRHCGGEIDRCKRFSAAWVKRGGHDGFRLVGADHEVKVGAHHAVCLVDDVAVVVFHHDVRCFRLIFFFHKAAHQTQFLRSVGKRHIAEHWNFHAFKVFAAAHFGVEHV